MDLHKIIHNAMHEFIQTYIPDADLSTLDDVLLSYITGVLEDLGSQQSVEENFDVEVFGEMLEAYIPGFAEIESVKVCEMMFILASKLATARTSADEQNEVSKEQTEETSPKLVTISAEPPPESETQCLTNQTEGAAAKPQVSEWEAQEQHLLEMFPKCSLSEARSALSIAKGDMEEAVRLIIEGDVQLSSSPLNVNQGKNISVVADHKLKESILEKYMLVDREDDKKTHRPVAPKDAPKKLVRYHSNQVVTTKGERYQLVKTNEAEDMKKTYVNLKPARKYRFH
ncbi:CUE domain-containing protein 2 [Notolabrus celidotus]|uniref:CUE domain-containing protein 2 n=1 Tax=Notolabrus celidotus TaxID=1203425 RepID=UPI0014901C4D|nr:CUE domain-containing protein 2 [Notolabrus celidotus]XP_034538461.1 CUE domain-containing protein 2 [Notolabrus celidotus]XP_034538462.1 CUE domain-containing protein 2 [Notolabrus celidotus]XP_034538463.1 CUE domain-containing protein 2 [Notolabrus celidotus]XP_034538464.1 CUE domain-containing protein 2 [Notolabrus celidotus]